MEQVDVEDENQVKSTQDHVINIDGLPNYSETSPETDARSTAKALSTTAVNEGLVLPLTNVPAGDDFKQIARDIVDSFFDAVKTKKDEAVAMMIEEKLVTANTINMFGETPLLIAVTQGDVRMVQELLDFDADVNAYGKYYKSPPSEFYTKPSQERTPLQLAAHLGNLNLVKLFVEVYHADDASIAPDGALALRLAAEGGHRDIVAYLPQRRGGGWRRWKTKHAVAMRRVKIAASMIFMVFYCILWYIPKLIVQGIWESGVYMWKNRVKIALRIKAAILKIPDVAAGMAKECWRALKKFPELVKKGIKVIPRMWKTLVEFVKRIPFVVSTVALWLWHGLCSVGRGLKAVGLSIVSFLHTFFSKLFNMISGITWADVRNGFTAIFHAIFVTFPGSVVSWLKTFGRFSYDALKGLFKTTGKVLWWLGRISIAIVMFIPQQLWKIVTGFGTSFSKAFEEILVFFDPKRVSKSNSAV